MNQSDIETNSARQTCNSFVKIISQSQVHYIKLSPLYGMT